MINVLSTSSRYYLKLTRSCEVLTYSATRMSQLQSSHPPFADQSATCGFSAVLHSPYHPGNVVDLVRNAVRYLKLQFLSLVPRSTTGNCIH